jgi:hypothetical protein
MMTNVEIRSATMPKHCIGFGCPFGGHLPPQRNNAQTTYTASRKLRCVAPDARLQANQEGKSRHHQGDSFAICSAPQCCESSSMSHTADQRVYKKEIERANAAKEIRRRALPAIQLGNDIADRVAQSTASRALQPRTRTYDKLPTQSLDTYFVTHKGAVADTTTHPFIKSLQSETAITAQVLPKTCSTGSRAPTVSRAKKRPPSSVMSCLLSYRTSAQPRKQRTPRQSREPGPQKKKNRRFLEKGYHARPPTAPPGPLIAAKHCVVRWINQGPPVVSRIRLWTVSRPSNKGFTQLECWVSPKAVFFSGVFSSQTEGESWGETVSDRLVCHR